MRIFTESRTRKCEVLHKVERVCIISNFTISIHNTSFTIFTLYYFMTKQYLFSTSILLFLIILFISSCRKDTSYFEGNANFSTSVDTLLFDTVFTRVGSATRYFKIYNKESNPLLIDIKIKNSTSFFRMNVDGYKGNDLKEIEVPANDSIYVFVETTIDPDQPLSISPFIVEDQIIITQNNENKIVQLVAYGQNANYVPQLNANGIISVLSCNLGEVVWNDPKPYVIYGILIIDSCTLTMPAGTKVYVHGGIVVNENQVYNDGQIIILDNGRINIVGNFENKVIIQGDRLEADYEDVAGQWGGIRIFKNSKGNNINNAKIRNAIVGISIDSSSTLNISNTSIENAAAYGLYTSHSEVKGDNLLIFGSGSHSIALTYGGNYSFNYCTFYSDLNEDESVLMNNYLCLDALCSTFDPYPVDASFTNCILAGGSEDELALNPDNKANVGTTFKYQFTNCAIRAKELIEADNFPSFFDESKDCINLKSTDPLFIDRFDYDLHLDSMSILLDKAKVISNIQNDIDGKIRSPTTPDIGCYEF